jgi:hypothetical protein
MFDEGDSGELGDGYGGFFRLFAKQGFEGEP